ncbi:MAG: hypothetical protein IKO83_03610 [Oscillospiraceae bacterium]|nr:hypothetical protein [Oscillospiraceae bacterium]
MNKKARVWLCIALLVCLCSMILASAFQSDFGKVKISELRLVDSAGYEVSALLYKPASATSENPAPCIITVEGWFNNKEMQDLYSVEYARRGYVVIATDMHGHGDSESTDADNLYPAAVGIDASVELAGKLPYVDKTRIGVTGHSSGGAACDMAVAIDNEREVPLISAVLFEASTWVDDTGEDHATDLDGRYVGIIADLYDEFFFWTDDQIVPLNFAKSADAKNFVNFNRGSEGIEDVVAGKYYTDGDLFRVIWQPDCTHPWVHFSATSVGYGIQFFEDAFGAPHPLAPNDQVWQWKNVFNFLGLVSAVLSAVFFMWAMLDTRYFSILKAEEEAKPILVQDGKGKLWFWLPLCVCALFSGLSYYWCVDKLYSITTKFFVQNGPLLTGVWCLICGVFTVIVLFICYAAYGKKNGFDAAERGVKIGGKKLWRTIVLALMAAALVFLLLFFADFFFKTDFRLWVLTLKAFDADKVLIGLRYLPLFLAFYVVNSVATNCFNFNNIGGKLNVAILGLFNALGALGFIAIQYGTFFSTGALKWYSAEAWRISGIWLYPACVYLFFTPFLTRFIYKKTKNPYLCAIVNAILITMMACANTCTILGGGAVVASNY